MATGDSVQQIKDRLSIVDVISPYVELHKAGKNFKGKSPFTTEKTPSFYVSPDRGMYYCFSSSQGGDMFTFVQKMEGVDFKGALKILADKAGVELVPEDPGKRDHRDTLYQVIEETTRFFESELNKNETATKYLLDRAVTKETISKWRIGYAPDEWRSLKDYLNAKGFKDETLIEAGLAKRAEGGKQPYDVFRDRIMFPISDPSGRVIAFSGRILKKDTDSPKYVNSPETELFNKSEALFGYDKAKHGIHKLDFSMIVEGQFDVVLSHQAGYHNAVAVSGTALTNQHLSLLQRLSNRVVLALDSDKAGIAAVKRSAELALARGIDLKVARIEGGKDPADLVKEDPKLLRHSIGQATHVIEFLLDILKKESRDERTYKIRARDEILPYVLSIDSHIERDHFAGIIAAATGTTTDAIRLEITRLEATKKDKGVETKTDTETSKPAKLPLNRKEDLIAFLLAAETLLDISEQHLLRAGFIEATDQSLDDLREKTSPEKLSEMIFTLEQHWGEINPRFIRGEWEERIQQLKQIVLKEKRAELNKAILEAEKRGDESEIIGYISELNELNKKI